VEGRGAPARVLREERKGGRGNQEMQAKVDTLFCISLPPYLPPSLPTSLPTYLRCFVPSIHIIRKVVQIPLIHQSLGKRSHANGSGKKTVDDHVGVAEGGREGGRERGRGEGRVSERGRVGFPCPSEPREEGPHQWQQREDGGPPRRRS